VFAESTLSLDICNCKDKEMRKENKYDQLLLSTIIKLGVKSLDCRRHGICEVKLATDDDLAVLPLSGNRVHAYLELRNGKVLNLYFMIDSMNLETLNRYFCNNVFTVLEDSFFTLSKYDFLGTIKIGSGKYQLTKTARHYLANLEKEQVLCHNPFIVPKIQNLTSPAN
ncbi:MAG: hypothetical protein AAGG68_20675, partial [Bacteroidota bacterium]